jgi:hypothetical protein
MLAKLMTMSAADFVEQWFESEPLKATLSASGIIGTFLGPRSPGTAYVLLHHYMGEIDGAFRAWGFHKGGTGGWPTYWPAPPRLQGAEVRCNAGVARVEKVLVKAGLPGVVLDNGDEIRAPLVLSSLDPKHTFLRLVDPGNCRTTWWERCAVPDARLVGQGQPGPVRAAGVLVPGRASAAIWPGRSLHQPQASTTSSAPTTTPSTATSRASPTWTSSSRR